MFLIEFKFLIEIQHERDNASWKEPRYVYGWFSSIIDGHHAFQESYPEVKQWETNLVINLNKPEQLGLSKPIKQPLEFLKKPEPIVNPNPIKST